MIVDSKPQWMLSCLQPLKASTSLFFVVTNHRGKKVGLHSSILVLKFTEAEIMFHHPCPCMFHCLWLAKPAPLFLFFVFVYTSMATNNTCFSFTVSSAASDITTSNGEEEEGYNRKKKARTAFSREQVMELEKKFQEKKYLSSSERGELAEKLKLSDMQVKTWFQNRRMKLKRQVEEAEMELKSPKYPFGPLMPFSGMSPPFYGYNMNMMSSYKPDCFSFPYPSRPPATSLAASDRDFPLALPSPPYPAVPNSNFYPPRRPPPPQAHRNGFFPPNGPPFTPLSPSSQPCHLSGDTYNPISNSVQSYPNLPPTTTPAVPFTDWQRAIPTPPTP